jgi:hypothetical protein
MRIHSNPDVLNLYFFEMNKLLMKDYSGNLAYTHLYVAL